MNKAYEKPISESVYKWADRLKVDREKEPVKYPLGTFLLVPALIWTSLETLGLNAIVAFLLAMPYPAYMGYKMYLYFQLQDENPRPIAYEYDESTPIHVKNGTFILLACFTVIAISVFFVIPKTVSGGVALICIAALALWKTANDGRQFHKKIQETHGVKKVDGQG